MVWGGTKILGWLATLATSGVSLGLVAGYFGRVHPALDSVGHLRVHLAAGLIVLGLITLFLRGFRRVGAIAMVLGAVALLSVFGASLIPGLAPATASSERVDETAPIYRLMQLNLRFDNPEPGKVLSLIGRIRPDVMTLEEVSPMWAEKLALLESAYPYRVICPIDDYSGSLAILSRRPFAAETKGKCMQGGTFATVAVDFGGRSAEIGALHLQRPWPGHQARQLDGVEPLVAAMSDTAILAGGINATPWSAASARVAEAGGMTVEGPPNPTWLWRRLPEWMRLAGFPVDRIFSKGEVFVRSVRTEEWVGSDHLPVVADFSFRTPHDGSDDAARTATAFLAP